MTNQTVILEMLEILEAKYSYHNISYDILCNSITNDPEIAELWGNNQLPTMEEFDNALCGEIYTIDTLTTTTHGGDYKYSTLLGG